MERHEISTSNASRIVRRIRKGAIQCANNIKNAIEISTAKTGQIVRGIRKGAIQGAKNTTNAIEKSTANAGRIVRGIRKGAIQGAKKTTNAIEKSTANAGRIVRGIRKGAIQGAENTTNAIGSGVKDVREISIKAVENITTEITKGHPSTERVEEKMYDQNLTSNHKKSRASSQSPQSITMDEDPHGENNGESESTSHGTQNLLKQQSQTTTTSAPRRSITPRIESLQSIQDGEDKPMSSIGSVKTLQPIEEEGEFKRSSDVAQRRNTSSSAQSSHVSDIKAQDNSVNDNDPKFEPISTVPETLVKEKSQSRIYTPKSSAESVKSFNFFQDSAIENPRESGLSVPSTDNTPNVEIKDRSASEERPTRAVTEEYYNNNTFLSKSDSAQDSLLNLPPLAIPLPPIHLSPYNNDEPRLPSRQPLIYLLPVPLPPISQTNDSYQTKSISAKAEQTVPKAETCKGACLKKKICQKLLKKIMSPDKTKKIKCPCKDGYAGSEFLDSMKRNCMTNTMSFPDDQSFRCFSEKGVKRRADHMSFAKRSVLPEKTCSCGKGKIESDCGGTRYSGCSEEFRKAGHDGFRNIQFNITRKKNGSRSKLICFDININKLYSFMTGRLGDRQVLNISEQDGGKIKMYNYCTSKTQCQVYSPDPKNCNCSESYPCTCKRSPNDMGTQQSIHKVYKGGHLRKNMHCQTSQSLLPEKISASCHQHLKCKYLHKHREGGEQERNADKKIRYQNKKVKQTALICRKTCVGTQTSNLNCFPRVVKPVIDQDCNLKPCMSSNEGKYYNNEKVEKCPCATNYQPRKAYKCDEKYRLRDSAQVNITNVLERLRAINKRIGSTKQKMERSIGCTDNYFIGVEKNSSSCSEDNNVSHHDHQSMKKKYECASCYDIEQRNYRDSLISIVNTQVFRDASISRDDCSQFMQSRPCGSINSFIPPCDHFYHSLNQRPVYSGVELITSTDESLTYTLDNGIKKSNAKGMQSRGSESSISNYDKRCFPLDENESNYKPTWSDQSSDKEDEWRWDDFPSDNIVTIDQHYINPSISMKYGRTTEQTASSDEVYRGKQNHTTKYFTKGSTGLYLCAEDDELSVAGDKQEEGNNTSPNKDKDGSSISIEFSSQENYKEMTGMSEKNSENRTFVSKEEGEGSNVHRLMYQLTKSPMTMSEKNDEIVFDFNQLFDMLHPDAKNNIGAINFGNNLLKEAGCYFDERRDHNTFILDEGARSSMALPNHTVSIESSMALPNHTVSIDSKTLDMKDDSYKSNKSSPCKLIINEKACECGGNDRNEGPSGHSHGNCCESRETIKVSCLSCTPEGALKPDINKSDITLTGIELSSDTTCNMADIDPMTYQSSEEQTGKELYSPKKHYQSYKAIHSSDSESCFLCPKYCPQKDSPEPSKSKLSSTSSKTCCSQEDHSSASSNNEISKGISSSTITQDNYKYNPCTQRSKHNAPNKECNISGAKKDRSKSSESLKRSCDTIKQNEKITSSKEIKRNKRTKHCIRHSSRCTHIEEERPKTSKQCLPKKSCEEKAIENVTKFCYCCCKEIKQHRQALRENARCAEQCPNSSEHCQQKKDKPICHRKYVINDTKCDTTCQKSSSEESDMNFSSERSCEYLSNFACDIFEHCSKKVRNSCCKCQRNKTACFSFCPLIFNERKLAICNRINEQRKRLINLEGTIDYCIDKVLGKNISTRRSSSQTSPFQPNNVSVKNIRQYIHQRNLQSSCANNMQRMEKEAAKSEKLCSYLQKLIQLNLYKEDILFNHITSLSRTNYESCFPQNSESLADASLPLSFSCVCSSEENVLGECHCRGNSFRYQKHS